MNHRAKLMISDWKIGFEKIQFTKMLQEELSLGLSDAKSITDTVLERKPVEISIGSEDIERIAKLAVNLGAVVHIQGSETACR